MLALIVAVSLSVDPPVLVPEPHPPTQEQLLREQLEDRKPSVAPVALFSLAGTGALWFSAMFWAQSFSDLRPNAGCGGFHFFCPPVAGPFDVAAGTVLTMAAGALYGVAVHKWLEIAPVRRDIDARLAALPPATAP